MNRKNLALILVLAWIALCFGACARTVVQPETEMKGSGLPRPHKIIVCDFAVSEKEAIENRGHIQKRPHESSGASEGAKQDIETGRQAANTLTKELVVGLHDLGFAVERRPRGTSAGRDQLLINGEFLDVDEGNRLERLVIGFGVGASKVDTEVHVFYGGNHRKVLDFKTHADSGRMPGAAVTMGAGAAVGVGVAAGTVAAEAASGALKEYQSEVDRMAKHSADQAVAYLSEFFAKQHWIRPDQVKTPKVENR